MLLHHLMHLLAAQALVDGHVGVVAAPHDEGWQPGDLKLLGELREAVLVDPREVVVRRQLAEERRGRRAMRARLRAELEDRGHLARATGPPEPLHVNVVPVVRHGPHSRPRPCPRTSKRFF